MTESLLDVNVLEMCKYKHVYVAFSGGLDSSVLLHCVGSCPELFNQVTAVHIHHGLSPHADRWQMHCQSVCTQLNIPLLIRHVTFDVATNIEEGARNARLAAFSSVLEEGDGILLAHHCDDQAETLLLQLIRGAGIGGLSAMPAIKKLGKGELVRPLLSYSRKALEAYAVCHKLEWVEDESNQNDHFSRNYLRNQIIPLLKKKWPQVASNLFRTANHCQQACLNLQALAKFDCAFQENPPHTLPLSALRTHDPARVANVLRAWFSAHHIRMPSQGITNRILDEVVFAREHAVSTVAWGNVSVRRYQSTLYLVDAFLSEWVDVEWPDFPGDLVLKESVSALANIGRGERPFTPTFDAETVTEVVLNHQRYLRARPATSGLLVSPLSRVSVRKRGGKDVFHFRGQTKSLKKLYQEWQIPPWQRSQIPLLYINDELAAVVGYAVSDRYYAQDRDLVYSVEFL